jgi:FHA domain
VRTILVSAIVGGIVSVITAYFTTLLRMREDRTKWHREFLLKYAQTASVDRQALAEQFAAGYLIVEHPDGEREKCFVPLAGSLTLGRSPGGVMLKEASISRAAARIVSVGTSVLLEHLGSRTPITLNDAQSPVQQCELHDGDLVKIGKTRVWFHTLKSAL